MKLPDGVSVKDKSKSHAIGPLLFDEFHKRKKTGQKKSIFFLFNLFVFQFIFFPPFDENRSKGSYYGPLYLFLVLLSLFPCPLFSTHMSNGPSKPIFVVPRVI